MHQDYLLQALTHAKIREGFCAPNPAVGCILVKEGHVIASGTHLECGGPHAEINALSIAGSNARGAIAYITLEPCAHTGRTPPCTNALINAGVEAVYYSFADPNDVATGGEAALHDAGIHCQQLALPEISEFYQPYSHWIKTGKATLSAKLALSLDGKYANQDGPAAITGDALAEFTMTLRKRHDAIVTSINTVKNDNPKLSVRFPDKTIRKTVFVLDPLAELPLTAQLFETAARIIVLHSETAPTTNIDKLIAKGVTCECAPDSSTGQLAAEYLLELVGRFGFHTAWIETGANWLTSLIQANVLNKLYLYYGNQVLGKNAMSAAFPNTGWLQQAQDIKWQMVGNEVYCKITLGEKEHEYSI